MSNPKSLGWGLEMWGYGFLGVATWLVAPVFSRAPVERWTARAFIANGPVSIVPAFATAFAPGWELSTLGLISFGVWNLLVLAMAPLAMVALQRRAASAAWSVTEPVVRAAVSQSTSRITRRSRSRRRVSHRCASH